MSNPYDLHLEVRLVDGTGTVHGVAMRDVSEDVAFVGERPVEELRAGLIMPEHGETPFDAAHPNTLDAITRATMNIPERLAMADPILKAAVDLKKKTDSVKSPEIDTHMNEIMKILLGAVQGDKKNS